MDPNRPKGGWAAFKTRFQQFCGLLFFVAVIISVTEIVARVFFRFSLDLFFDFSVWITVWAFLLIAGPILPDGDHVSIDFLRQKLDGAPRRVVEVVLAVITLGYGVFITVGGIWFIQQLHAKKALFPRYVPIPMWIVELCVPIGMGIFSLFAVVCLFRALRQRF
jgi:TRAP-type C4-dicarboxylate transport system permease small subunit